MATTTLQHPIHDHPLVPLDLSNESITRSCGLCRRKIYGEAYTCHEGCDSYYHRLCAEAPPLIECHPLHPAHPLSLIHRRGAFTCDCCSEGFDSRESSFRCNECAFELDIGCALSTLSDQAGSQFDKTSEHITLPLHPHPLTSFYTRHDFVWDSTCAICWGSVERGGYMCLQRSCKFIIHKECIQDLHYADGTKAPCVYHDHPLETFGGDHAGSRTCSSCGSDESDEFIGCARCKLFYHRHCIQVPDIRRYPSHHPDHTLVLFLNGSTFGPLRLCQSCSSSLKTELYYRCTSCAFFLHVGCALQVLTYCEEGTSARINLSWHEHPLYLCHRTKSASDDCSYCEDELTGPTYACNVEDCSFLLHKRCTEIGSTIIHPHHPDHPLTLSEWQRNDDIPPLCEACYEMTSLLNFSCELCLFYLHVNCAAHFPTQKHYLHEHKLVRFEKLQCLECNRCGTSTDSPIFRCVPCNFNLHEKCMDLPSVVKHDTHFHPLTLREFFREDDTGEYYCDLCEQMRNGELGVYVCGQCERKMDRPWVFHIECILPELRKVYEKVDNTAVIDRIANEILCIKAEVCETEEKLDKMKQKLEGLIKKHAALTSKE